MPYILTLSLCGLLVGILSGLLGIGGGVLLVPILLFVFKVEMHQAIGTSLAVIIPTAFFASYVHFQHGNVSIKIVLGLCVFTIIGGIIGANLSSLLPATILKKVFAVFLVLIAIKMFIGK